MRAELCKALVARAGNPDMVFLTGDVGFMALEALQQSLGRRFINAGLGEQNMLTVAAALAKSGHETWVYSIAPFCYARPFEQIRNDICMHELPVRICGNGGGYAYGIMGQTHYALEDYGILATLPSLKIFTPVFGADISAVVDTTDRWAGPSYVRLGRDELPKGMKAPPYAPWRQLLAGAGPVIAVVGPLAGGVWEKLAGLDGAQRPNLWCVAELPVHLSPPPAPFLHQLRLTRRLLVAEEHVAHGGLGSQLALWMLEKGVVLDGFRHLHARNTFPQGYGSQNYLRHVAGIDADSIGSCLSDLRATLPA